MESSYQNSIIKKIINDNSLYLDFEYTILTLSENKNKDKVLEVLIYIYYNRIKDFNSNKILTILLYNIILQKYINPKLENYVIEISKILLKSDKITDIMILEYSRIITEHISQDHFFTSTHQYINFIEYFRQYFEQYNISPSILSHCCKDIIKNTLFNSLISMSYGDAIGFMVEGYNRSKCNLFLENVVEKGLLPSYGVQFKDQNKSRYCQDNYCFKFGQYTDDTQCSRELLISIHKNYNHFNPEDYSQRLLSLFVNAGLVQSNIPVKTTNRIIGYGTTTLNSMKNIGRGIKWNKASNKIGKGNGACMRVAQIGIIFYKDPDKVSEIATKQAIITHNNRTCIQSSILIAQACRLAVCIKISCKYDIKLNQITFINSLTKYLDDDIASLIKLIPEKIQKQEIHKYCLEIGKHYEESEWKDIISPGALQSSIYALACFLENPHCIMSCIKMAIKGGGDTDSVAAMACAMVGSYSECDILHDLKYSYMINDLDSWKEDDLRDLCENF